MTDISQREVTMGHLSVWLPKIEIDKWALGKLVLANHFLPHAGSIAGVYKKN
jgi:hypothetical protein